MPGTKEAALSNFFKVQSGACKSLSEKLSRHMLVDMDAIPLSGYKGVKGSEVSAVESLGRRLCEMGKRLDTILFLSSQEEGVRADVFRDLEEGRTLGECIAGFKELLEDTNLLSSLRQQMGEEFELLNQEHAFEP